MQETGGIKGPLQKPLPPPRYTGRRALAGRRPDHELGVLRFLLVEPVGPQDLDCMEHHSGNDDLALLGLRDLVRDERDAIPNRGNHVPLRTPPDDRLLLVPGHGHGRNVLPGAGDSVNGRKLTPPGKLCMTSS